MNSEQQCSSCDYYMIPIATCNTCREYVYWTCSNCNQLVFVSHSHNYCRVSYSNYLDRCKVLVDKSALLLISVSKAIINSYLGDNIEKKLTEEDRQRQKETAPSKSLLSY